MRFQNSLLPILAVFLLLAASSCTLQADKEEDAFEEVKYDSLKMIVDDVGPVAEQDMTGNWTGRMGFMNDSNLDGRPDSFYQLPSPTAGIIGLAFGDDGYAAAGKAFGMARFKAGQTQYETPLKSLTEWVRDGVILEIQESRYVDQPDTLVYLDRMSGEEMTAPLTGKKEEITYDAPVLGLVTLGQDLVTKSYPASEQYKIDDYVPKAGEELYGRCIDEPEDNGDEDEPDYQEVCMKLDDAGLLSVYGNVPCADDADCDSGYSCQWGYCYNRQERVFQQEPWGVTRCMQEMYYHNDGAGGTRFNACLMNKCLKVSDSKVPGCFEKCKVEQLSDENGCSGEHNPEINDVVYVVKSPMGVYQIEEGGAVVGTNSLSVFVDYMDADCNFHSAGNEWTNVGQVVVQMTEGAQGGTTFTLPPGALELGCNSFEDKKLLGFTFAGLQDGNYKFKVTLKSYKIKTSLLVDAKFVEMKMQEQSEFIAGLEENQKENDVVSIYCDKAGAPYEGTFVVSDYVGGDDMAAYFENLTFLMYETYVQDIDEYTLGKGFIDVLAADPIYQYNLMEFDVSMIQGYIWSVIDEESFPDWDMDALNSAIFTTTQDNRHTKYNENDDIQASAFYLDQPMTPGLFTFHGNAGWNIYPKAPYGSNNDQPFVLGNFETDAIYMPMRPFTKVNPAYSGCNFTADYWADFLYHDLAEERGLIDGKLQRVYSCERLDNLINDYFGGRDEATFIEDAEAYNAWPYWNCRINCLKNTDGGTNGCYTLEDCLDRCTTEDPKVLGKRVLDQCEMPGYDYMNLQVDVTIPAEFQISPKYSHLFNEPADPTLCFDEDALTCNDDGTKLMRCVSGRWVEEEDCAAMETICLPTASSYACDDNRCDPDDECELACSGKRVLECVDREWIVSETCGDGYTCDAKQCKPVWEPLRVGLIPLSTLSPAGDTGLSTQIPGVPGGYVDFVPGVAHYLVPLPYMPYVTPEAASTISTTDWVTFQLYMALFDRDGNVYAVSKNPANTDPSFTQSHMVMWNSNWVGADMEGWTLAEVEIAPGSLSLTGTVNPFETLLQMTFGDIEASGEENLEPASVPQWK